MKRTFVWNKDDDSSMSFVCASANLRAYAFRIGARSLFDVKAMAGNIIPAVATTNACIAGLVVMEALKILADLPKKCQTTFLIRQPNSRGKIFLNYPPEAPNRKCYVCQPLKELLVKVNTNRMTVKKLEERVLKGALKFVAPDVEIVGASSGSIIISSDEGETEYLGERTLTAVKVVDGTILQCDDFAQDEHKLRIIVQHFEEFEQGIDFEIVFLE